MPADATSNLVAAETAIRATASGPTAGSMSSEAGETAGVSTGSPTSSPAARTTASTTALIIAANAAALELDSAGWLSADRQVLLRTDAEQGGGPAPALCEYIFGPRDEVVVRAGLPLMASLMPGGGVHTSATGAFILCPYADGDGVQAILEIGQSADTWGNGITTIVHDGDVQAVLSYVPDYAGEPLAKAEATTWLRDALTRVEY